MTDTDRDVLLPPLPRTDPLSVYLHMQQAMSIGCGRQPSAVRANKAVWANVGDETREAPHALRPFSEKLSHLVRFSELVDLQWCGVRTQAAVYVAARLFGSDWRKVAPHLSSDAWADRVDAFVESSAGKSAVSPIELVEISRLFRLFVRTKRSLYNALARHKDTTLLENGARLARDAFCVEPSAVSEQFRIALFAIAVAHADQDRVPMRSRQKLARLLGRYSFATATQCADIERTLCTTMHTEQRLVARALQSFLARDALRS